MKIAILCAIILSAAIANAETTIIEYPDNYYVESTGTPEATSTPSRESVTPSASVTPVTFSPEVGAPPPAKSRPVTNFGSTPQPVGPAERRAAMNEKILQLQNERSELMAPREGDTSDQVALRQQEAEGKLRKINKMSSELLKIPVQGIEQGN